MESQSLTSFVNKAYRRLPVGLAPFQRFIDALSHLFGVVNDNQTEEEQKSHFKEFLTSTFYRDYYMAPEGNVDITIHNGKNQKSDIALMIEFKRTTNKSEMISCENLNRKALQELLLYYLRERVAKKNTDLKYLMVTNIREVFIFDAQEFEKKFYNNRNLIREFIDYERKSKSYTTTDGFYKDIATRYIGDVENDLQFTHINLDDYKKFIQKTPLKSRKLIELYKALSAESLLKLPLQNDSNTLNRKFYNELLHIIGIKEKRKGNKVVIVRKDPSERNDASLIENAISRLDSMNCLYNLKTSDSSENYEGLLFDVAMELCITWINRILFLKLLEAQLVKYHNGDNRFRFLTTEKMKCFNDLDTLFFKVVACDYGKRSFVAKRDYDFIPYLNSSLFEVTELENKTLRIGNLTIRESLPLCPNSVLEHGKVSHYSNDLNSLEYLLSFLDSYDFASEDDEEVKSDPKTLINASVLGLIFEKINGHKDGAVFTPGYITMYMCRESLKRVVVNRFNARYGWCLGSYKELLNTELDIAEANAVIDDIKICDPSVGSGHFLVSALNEILRIKFELGILADKNGIRIMPRDYTITVENDELIVMNSDGSVFCYNPLNKESRRVQETLFNEKRRIIENCLFGVDINQSSVNICRLRLWIELLKNTYYTEESGLQHLETLPNIDINIKHGNSLLHRFSIDSKLTTVLRNSGVTVGGYKSLVSSYKSTSDKKVKHDLDSLISDVKIRIRTEIFAEDKDLKQMKRLQAQLLVDENPLDLGLTDDALPQRVIRKRIAETKKEIARIKKKIDDKRIEMTMPGAFEWRFEFPELLDGDGNFIGFDLVIGNPPYIQLQSMRKNADILEKMNYSSFVRTGDIYCLFYELGLSLMRDGGLLSFITSNKWMKADYGTALRGLLATHSNPLLLVDFGNCQIFDEVSVSTNILSLEKRKNSGKTECCKVDRKEDAKKLGTFVPQSRMYDAFTDSCAWSILSPVENEIRRKIERRGKLLGTMDVVIYRGVLTGCNEAFLISTSKRDEILSNCRDEEERKRTEKLIRPILRGRDIRMYGYDWENLFLIAMFPSRNYDIEDFPSVKDHLLSFAEDILRDAGYGWVADRDLADFCKQKLSQTGKFIEIAGERIVIGNTPEKARKKTSNKWFETQDGISYWEDFAKPKLVWLTITDSPKFAFDDTGAITLNSSYIMTGDNLMNVLVCLNSKLIRWYFGLISSSTGEGTTKWEKFAVEQIPIADLNCDAEELKAMITEGDYDALDRIVAEAYGLSDEESEYISGLF